MKNTLKVLGIIALVAVIGFGLAACNNGDDDDDNNNNNNNNNNNSSGGGAPVAVTPPAELVGSYFDTDTNAAGTDVKGRKFKITAEGHLIDLTEADSVTRDYTITAVNPIGILTLSRLPRGSTTALSGTVTYAYGASATPPTLTIAVISAGDDPTLGVSGNLQVGTYYKR